MDCITTSWGFRYMLNGKSRYMGLGPYPGVTLAEARREAEGCRKLLGDGTDQLRRGSRVVRLLGSKQRNP
jgi:hypothetical protein